jgi:hypothetical protein
VTPRKEAEKAMRLIPDKQKHISNIRHAKLLSPADKDRLIADVEANGITEANEPEIIRAYEAEMARAHARFVAVTKGVGVLVGGVEQEIDEHIRDREKGNREFVQEFERYMQIRRKLSEPPRLLDYIVAGLRYLFHRRPSESSRRSTES